MPSGPLPPSPPELLDSKAMQRFFVALSHYAIEVVIFDTPSLLGLSDAAIIASKVDGTLVVVDTTRAKKGDLKEVKAVLEQAGARVLGCVVNKQHRKSKNAPYKNIAYTFDYGARRRSTSGGYNGENTNLPALSPVIPAPVIPAISKPPETPSLPDREEQNSRGTYGTNHVDSSPPSILPSGEKEETNPLPAVKKRRTGE